jgi:hypothetical protein
MYQVDINIIFNVQKVVPLLITYQSLKYRKHISLNDILSLGWPAFVDDVGRKN